MLGATSKANFYSNAMVLSNGNVMVSSILLIRLTQKKNIKCFGVIKGFEWFCICM